MCFVPIDLNMILIQYDIVPVDTEFMKLMQGNQEDHIPQSYLFQALVNVLFLF